MSMVTEANQAFGPISSLITEREKIKNVSGRVLILLHPSLYRPLKLTFPRDIGGLAHDSIITKELGLGSISQIVGVLSYLGDSN